LYFLSKYFRGHSPTLSEWLDEAEDQKVPVFYIFFRHFSKIFSEQKNRIFCGAF